MITTRTLCGSGTVESSRSTGETSYRERGTDIYDATETAFVGEVDKDSTYNLSIHIPLDNVYKYFAPS